MSEIRSQGQGQHEPLMSEKKRYPEVFKWKVASIIIAILITGFLITDIVLLVNYNNSQPRANNYSFLADILKQTAKSAKPLSRQQFVNIATGLTSSFSDLWFQTAELTASWTSANPLTLDTVAKFFTGDTDHQIYILQMTDGTSTYFGAIYSHVGFPVPQSSYKTYLANPKNQYFTFEIDQRQSTILGGGTNKNMPMSGSTSNLRNCNVLKLNQNSLVFLELIKLDFSVNPPLFTLSANNANTYTSCSPHQPPKFDRFRSPYNTHGLRVNDFPSNCLMVQVYILMETGKGDYIEQPICTVNGERVKKLYRKVKAVGQGSYSKCWLVQTDGSNSTYVIKIIPKKKLQLLVKQKLVYQIRIHQQLSHPNVVHLDHWFQDENNQYIFLQYCSKGNLQSVLQSRSRLSQREIRFYVSQIIHALMYIHSKNILHRDLKLCNFYLDSEDQVKLGDFGFACQLAYPNQLKRETCGTPNYIAPQAVSGFGYSFSSDVWAVGVILYRLRFRCCPFEGSNVRATLQKVKTCQYSFPKGEKMSNQLKDLIEKILVINYDDRLTLQQILSHPFFTSNSPSSHTLARSESKGFAAIRNIFSRDKKEKQKEKLSPKRSNSCETFKQIKQIFKNKSKGTLVTSMGNDFKTQQSINVTLGQSSIREQSSKFGGGTISIAQQSFSSAFISKRLEGTQRTNNFLGNMKQQMKLQTKTIVTKTSTSNVSQQLSTLSKKHYLPYQIQIQKDVTVIHYKQSIKQLIYNGSSYILHRNKQGLFDMSGNPFLTPSKILRYIIDNRINISQIQPEQQQFGFNSIQKILLFVSHKSHQFKDGIILRFGSVGNTFVAKMTSQQLFYIGNLTRQQNRLREQGKISLMYLREGRNYKCAEGVVLSRIYQGWIGNSCKTIRD